MKTVWTCDGKAASLDRCMSRSIITFVSGVDLDQFRYVLMITAIIVIPASVIAGMLADRFGLFWPLLAGLLVLVLSTLVMVTDPGPSQFLTGHYARIFVGTFVGPLFLSLCARLNPTGGLVAASGAFTSIGMSLAPLVGSMLITNETRDFLMLGLVACSAIGIILLCTMPLAINYRSASAPVRTQAVQVSNT